MLCVEDALDGIALGGKCIGGLPGLIARSRANLAAFEAWVPIHRLGPQFLGRRSRHTQQHIDLHKNRGTLVRGAVGRRSGHGGEENSSRPAGKGRRRAGYWRPSRRTGAYPRLGRRHGRNIGYRKRCCPWLDYAVASNTCRQSINLRQRRNHREKSSDQRQAVSQAAVEIFPQSRARGGCQSLACRLPNCGRSSVDYDGLAIRSNTKVTKELLEVATKLKCRRPRRHRRGQCRSEGGHRVRCGGDEHAARQLNHHRRTRHCPDVRAGP